MQWPLKRSIILCTSLIIFVHSQRNTTEEFSEFDSHPTSSIFLRKYPYDWPYLIPLIFACTVMPTILAAGLMRRRILLKRLIAFEDKHDKCPLISSASVLP
uniref:Uncharacterized protein n=1 Tax=Romanomermis culicivorax TaxID=13658 RepID=A0A915I5R9_ROMCU